MRGDIHRTYDVMSNLCRSDSPALRLPPIVLAHKHSHHASMQAQPTQHKALPNITIAHRYSYHANVQAQPAQHKALPNITIAHRHSHHASMQTQPEQHKALPYPILLQQTGTANTLACRHSQSSTKSRTSFSRSPCRCSRNRRVSALVLKLFMSVNATWDPYVARMCFTCAAVCVCVCV